MKCLAENGDFIDQVEICIDLKNASMSEVYKLEIFFFQNITSISHFL